MTLAANLDEGQSLLIVTGEANRSDKMAYLGYKKLGTGILGVHSTNDIITFNKSSINLNKPKTITGTFAVSRINIALKSEIEEIKSENKELRNLIYSLFARNS